MLRAVRQFSGAISKVLALLAREWREWRDLLAAQLRLFLAQIEVSTGATGQLVAADRVGATHVTPPAPRLDEARRVDLAISRASRFGLFRPPCLVRSIALCRMLDSRGLTGSHVQVGVTLEDGRLAAHAWVEYGGQVLGDDPESVAQFELLPRLNLRNGAANRPR